MSWLCLERKLVLPPDGVPKFVPLVVEPVTAPDPFAARTDAEVVHDRRGGAACGVRLHSGPCGGTCGGAEEGFVIFPDQAS